MAEKMMGLDGLRNPINPVNNGINHLCPTQLVERIIHLKDDGILDDADDFVICYNYEGVLFIDWIHNPIVIMDINGNADDIMILYS